MNNDKIQNEIIDEFSMFDDWLDKYDYLISLSESLPMIDAAKRTDKYLIEGCQSRVWVSSEYREGKVYYSADSDAIITKGIIALLIRVMNGRSAEELTNIDLYFVDAIGLGENLSPTRSNGLRAMIAQMKLDALVYTQQK
ncbi:MAG: SufE family protein [Alistipes sp.]|jgi:cysteine desulfuration protein SufE|nr:SufE family protein [Alistipes sp.]MBQ5924487.1 SufE family protein [Alistipes sp.]MBR5818811.1 SufE family protein [Alistipes sp.]MEE1148519.1 SufE family protein [Alistipes sp.]